MFWLKFISKFIKVLRAGESPELIAGGVALGLLVGLPPFWTLQSVALLVVAILTKVNLSAVFFSLFFFSFVAYLFDPLFHHLGYFLLVKLDALHGLWTTLYNWPLAPFSRFYNTVVLGSFVTALVFAFPVYLLAKVGIVAYRRSWAEKIDNWKIVRIVKGSTLFKWYLKIRDLRG
ncbi:MAG: TIGR03546 family protein [bacterium]